MVRSPAGAVALDRTGRANGRGAYVCRDEACIAAAMGRGGLAHALQTNLPATLADELRGVIAEEANHGA